MRSIRPTGNRSTEVKLASLFQEVGIKSWRRHLRLPGKPDFTFPRSRVVVFVDGDFWHGNPQRFVPPKSNVEFWMAKIAYNRRRDRRNNIELRRRGWTVIRVWESELRRDPLRVLRRIVVRL
jgi:DNA mismatch endonuclease (patch repair protein)